MLRFGGMKFMNRLRPKIVTKIFSVALFVLVFSSALSASLSCPCEVVKVADGDTANVLDQNRTQEKIRLGGFDAPESGHGFGRKLAENLARYGAVNTYTSSTPRSNGN